MELSSALRGLQALLPMPIYVVGGAVRDSFVGYQHFDIDLAGAFSPKELMELLAGTPYTVYPTSMKLGTVRIVCLSEAYEYTTFRTDSYRGGEHRPRDVVFSHNLLEDAKRRDFTVNAIYWNVRDVKIEDPLDGRADLIKKTLKATGDPHKVLGEDGLRILRMVRQAAELGFKVEEQTYAAAKQNIALLRDISPERIRDEFVKILNADTRHDIEKAHYRAMLMLEDLGALEYILPELSEGKGIEQRKDFHSYDVFDHILHAVENATPSARLGALFHDIAKPRLMAQTGSGKGHEVLGREIAHAALHRLKFSTKDIKKTERLISAHMFDQKSERTDLEVREFIQENYDIIDDVISLKFADQIAKGKGQSESASGMRLQTLKAQMEAEGVPMCVKGLKVDGADLIELKIPKESRGRALAAVLKKAARGKAYATREAQLEYLHRFSK